VPPGVEVSEQAAGGERCARHVGAGPGLARPL